ncbi:MAG: 5-methyltetrahydropteroyltriglutamate--homocysteine methyltransferase [Candidatus Peregrinibacteria bacterium Greene0416_19]|nr:MAG: 5-methyltetrahydropteroyltriglutamate--homocysteine methyltransferase [Candidatus Peregrinibacteria bacterium Greene0416_19]
MAITTTLGYPRIGEDRELKSTLEGYWSGKRSAAELERTARTIRLRNWQRQKAVGIDLIPSNDFSLYDHVLDTSTLIGAVPERFRHVSGDVSLDTYFAMARGSESPGNVCECTHEAVTGIVAQNLRKWFDTNYHYLVPEFTPDQQFTLSSQKPFREFEEALATGTRTKPVLLGPVSYLLLGRTTGEPFDKLELLDRLLPVYGQILERLRTQGTEWIQLDEPALVLDLEEPEQQAFVRAYDRLRVSAGDMKVFLGTYFGELRDNLDLALALPVDAVHLDAVEAWEEASRAIEVIPREKTLSLGVVDGRNVWKNDLQRSLELLLHAKEQLGSDRLIIAPSSSFLHVPHSLERETSLPTTVSEQLAFTHEKLQEIVTLSRAVDGQPDAIEECLVQSATVPPTTEKEQFVETAVPYRAPADERRRLQADRLQLPLFPTTTIGSAPQTAGIRFARDRHRRGEWSTQRYEEYVRTEIAAEIRRQEETGLDVLTHGEFERNDMVQYFAERLDGIATTKHGWVQSFGSRCVRPPIIHGDVKRTGPITVEWSRYAQSLTEKPVKGMLTGPVTIWHWSYAREDLPAREVCRQIALALREEVRDLETAGIRIIQIDEPALREGLPLRNNEQGEYLRWATGAFRTVVVESKPETQIHTHMCYSAIEDILPVLRDLDCDVITIEAARSRLAFLNALDGGTLPCAIGPGIWDIHSPRVPSTEELVALIERARRHIPDGQLWINPDCGLKTRSPEEVWAALQHLVEAARIVRGELGRKLCRMQPQASALRRRATLIAEQSGVS